MLENAGALERPIASVSSHRVVGPLGGQSNANFVGLHSGGIKALV